MMDLLSVKISELQCEEEGKEITVNLPAVSMKTTANFNERAAHSTGSKLCQQRI